jgi:hypothetical protein
MLEDRESQLGGTLQPALQQANVSTSLVRQHQQSCRVHPQSSHSNAQRCIQHPELKNAFTEECSLHPQSRHKNQQYFSQRAKQNTQLSNKEKHTVYSRISTTPSGSTHNLSHLSVECASDRCGCFIVDCGSSNHMTSISSIMKDYRKFDGLLIELGDKSLIESTGVENVDIHDACGNLIKMSDVYHVPIEDRWMTPS